MTVFGPDISKWQDGIQPAGLGYGFLIARASIGRTVDYLYGSIVEWARGTGAPFAGYHFPYECSSHPAAEQAATWDKANGGDRAIPCMIDWESDGSQVPTVDDAINVANAITALGYRVTLLYSGKWYWQQEGSPDLTRLNDLGIAFIMADYGDNIVGEYADVYAHRGGDGGRGWNEIGGITPTFWQFGSQVHIGTYKGAPMYGDANAFRGSPDQLGNWFCTWGSTPTPPTPTPPPDVWVCPPYPGLGDYGASYETTRAWQDAMILNGYISDNAANHDGVWGDGMHNATYRMQQSWGWGDADGVGGEHTWPHLRSRNVAPCPRCGG